MEEDTPIQFPLNDLNAQGFSALHIHLDIYKKELYRHEAATWYAVFEIWRLFDFIRPSDYWRKEAWR